MTGVIAMRPTAQHKAQEHDSSPWSGVTLPVQFGIDAKGVFRVKDRSYISGPLWVAATTCDPLSNDHGLLLKWIDVRGKPQEFPILRNELHGTTTSLAANLAKKGLSVTPGSERVIPQYLAEFDFHLLPQLNSVARVGWIDADSELEYMTPPPRGLIAAGEHSDVIFQPESFSPSISSMYSRGTLQEWNDSVIHHCRDNPLLLFAALCGLSGPLLRPAEVESHGFHFYGRSSHGKTTAAQAAASVWGNGADPAESPDRAYVQKWNSTANALEALLAAHNDGLLVLDEIHTCDAADFGRVLYNMSGGKGRNALDRERQLRPTRKWRTAYFSTGEISVVSRIEAGGQQVHAGQQVRLIDIPIENGTISNSGSRTPRRHAEDLKHACAKYFGTAGPAFVEALIREYGSTQRLVGTVKTIVEAYVQELTPLHSPPEHQRIYKRFAFVRATGAFATQLGIIDCTPEQVNLAVRTALRAWQSGGATLPDRVRGVRNVQRFIQQHESRFQKHSEVAHDLIPRDRAGWVTENDDGANCRSFLFTEQGFCEACEDQNALETARELLQRGFLFANESGRYTVKRCIDGSRPRVYLVRASILNLDSRDLCAIPDGSTGAAGAPGAVPSESIT